MINKQIVKPNISIHASSIHFFHVSKVLTIVGMKEFPQKSPHIPKKKKASIEIHSFTHCVYIE